MINLRYHIVSITAVFLALGIGIAMGSTFLSRAAVERIDANVQNARTEVRKTRAENSVLRTEVQRLSDRGGELTDEAVGRLFSSRLEDVPVVAIAAPGIDQQSLDDLRRALTGSGAAFEGTLVVSDKVRLEGGDADDLAKLLDSSSTSASALRRTVTTSVADELVTAARSAPAEVPSTSTSTTTSTTSTTSTTMPFPPAGPTSSTPSTAGPDTTASTTTTTTRPARPASPTVTTALVDAGFLDWEPADAGVGVDEMLRQRGYRYVVVTGPDADVDDDTFIRPLLLAMAADRPAPVVVASAATGDDPEAVREAAIAPLLDDDTIAGRISTVDDLETLSGVAAVVLSLEDLGTGRRGHYGVGNGAKAQLPPAFGQ